MIGPFEVMEHINPNVYRLRLPDSYPMHPLINIEHLRKYKQSPPEFQDCATLPPMQDFLPTEQYFTVPHLFLQESGHSSGIPVESTGIHRNSSGILQESTHSSGILLEFHWNKSGIKQTKVEILIYLSQFLKLCRYIHFCLSLPFLHNVYSSTLPLKFNLK